MSESTTTKGKITIHKEGEEGVITLDGYTGIITSEITERPDWADGLACAMLAERTGFYTQRLGEKAAGEHLGATVIASQDLAWVGVDDESGDEITMDADPDFRMEVLATVLGVDREGFDDDKAFGETVAEVEIAMDTTRSAEEAELLDQGMEETFGTADLAAGRAEGGAS